MAEQVSQGQVLGGRFELTEPFAEDPLLEVWLAEDLELRRDVVIKLLLPRWMEDEEMVERFRFESLAAAQLLHENIARTYDVETSAGRLYAVTEYVPGPTVATLMEGAPLAPVVVAALIQQAAKGLASMHDEGLAHAAVTPHNLLVAPNGRLCIVDFGSTRLIGQRLDHPEPVFPEPGASDYWSPERLGGATPDDRSDVYALGLLAWEALTGTREVATTTPQRPMRRLLASLPGGDDVTPRLRELLLEATADDPDRRPTAREFAEALAEICGERPQEHLEPLVADFEVAD